MKYKFKIGEKIFDKVKGEGTIDGYHYNSIFGDDEYIVKWDNGATETIEMAVGDSYWSYVLDPDSQSFLDKLGPPASGSGAPKDVSKKLLYGNNPVFKINGEVIAEIKGVSFEEVRKNGDIHIVGSVSTKDCNHDPIDVGFVRPKMVCRKCNEDL